MKQIVSNPILKRYELNPIIVLGFGRSGTTWLSDIISKVTGGLLLFEPFHPSVTDRSREFSYSTISDERQSEFLIRYFNDLFAGRHRKKWLLRNHIPQKVDEISENFIQCIWEECNIIGFKCIRCNFMIDWFKAHLNAKIVFVVRHPCAVIASILRRRNFWEFGWPETYELFLSKTVDNEFYNAYKFNESLRMVKNADADIARYAIMWAVTHAISLRKLVEFKIPVLFYEDVYSDPFSIAKKLIRYLGYENSDIHPSYLFTPSMTSLKTIHGLYGKDDDISNKGAKAFWEGVLSDFEVDTILEISELFSVNMYDRSGFPARRNWCNLPIEFGHNGNRSLGNRDGAV